MYKLNHVKSKVSLIALSLMTSVQVNAAGIEDGIGVGKDTNIVNLVIQGSPIVSAVIRSAIIFGILFSIFKIAQELLDGQGGGGGKMWGKFGAIIAFGAIYYFLFVKTSATV